MQVLPTEIAHEPLPSVLVDPHDVLFEVFLLEEGLPADVALDVLVGLVVFGVARHVTLESGFVVATPSAHVADMVAGPVFGSHVVEVLLVGDESAAADLALGHVLLQVPLSVDYERPFGFEGLRAKVALECGVVAVHSHMYIDVVLPFEALVADVAGERSLGAVRQEVLIESALVLEQFFAIHARYFDYRFALYPKIKLCQ